MTPSKTKKILYVCNTDWFFLSHRKEIALAAIKHGYEVHLAAPAGDCFDKLAQLQIQVHSVPFTRSGSNPLRELKTIFHLRTLLREIDPDIVHAITPKPTLYMALLSRLGSNRKLIVAVSGLGHAFTVTNTIGRIRKFILSNAYRFLFSYPKITAIFQNSQDRDIISGLCPNVADNSVLLFGSGVDLNNYVYHHEVNTDRLRVVMASRLLWHKGVGDFVAAARIVKDKFPDVTFDLYGKIDDHPTAISSAELEQWNKEGLVNWLSHCNDIAKQFQHCHIVILPTYYGEGMPKVLLEAAACGRPAITTNFAGCKEAVIDGVTGLLIEPKDAHGLASAIEKLLTNKAMREQMGQNARKRAERHFSVEDIVAEHLKIYQSPAEATHGGPSPATIR